MWTGAAAAETDTEFRLQILRTVNDSDTLNTWICLVPVAFYCYCQPGNGATV